LQAGLRPSAERWSGSCRIIRWLLSNLRNTIKSLTHGLQGFADLDKGRPGRLHQVPEGVSRQLTWQRVEGVMVVEGDPEAEPVSEAS